MDTSQKEILLMMSVSKNVKNTLPKVTSSSPAGYYDIMDLHSPKGTRSTQRLTLYDMLHRFHIKESAAPMKRWRAISTPS